MMSFRTSPTNYPTETKYKTPAISILIQGEVLRRYIRSTINADMLKNAPLLQTRIMSPKKKKKKPIAWVNYGTHGRYLEMAVLRIENKPMAPLYCGLQCAPDIQPTNGPSEFSQEIV
jgi:hypothetical protein